MGVYRRVPAHGAENLGLAKGICKVIVTPDGMGNSHIVVVDNDRKHIGRRTVGPQHDQVVQFAVGNRHGPLNGVLDNGFAFPGRFESDHRLYAGGGIRRIAIAPGAVVTHRTLFRLCLFAHFCEFFGGAVAAIGSAFVDQLLRNLRVALPARKLVDGLVIGIEAQPGQPVENGVYRFRGRTLAVGILDPQQEFAAGMAGIQPVEQGGSGTADMQEPRW